MSQHGGDIYSYIEKYNKNPIDFSANINPLGMPEEVKIAIKECIENLVNYPDTEYKKLKNAIALEYNIDKNQIVCGNGGADIIFRLLYAIRPANALLPAPMFSEYETALNQIECDIDYYLMDKSFNINLDFIDRINNNTDIIIICNPNNPTSILTPKSLIKKILNKIQGTKTLLFIDECFNDMLDNPEAYSMISEIEKYPNLFILRSLTKMYAIPGIRLGYGICSDKGLIEKINNQGQAWSVNSIAIEAGCVALKCRDYKISSKQYIQAERKFLYEELCRLGLEVIKPTANYIFFKIKGVENLKEKLYAYNIIIRSCENYHNLDKEYYRVAVRLHNENELLLNAVKLVLKEEGENRIWQQSL